MDKIVPNLTKKQIQAIPIVLEAHSITDGLKKARVAKSTFYAWLKDPVFKTEFIRQRQEVVEFALHELKVSAGEATQVMRELLKSKNENVRLRASMGILDHVSKFIELEKIEARVDALEREVKQ